MTMKSVDLPHLRSVVLAGHAGAGKTTLGEQLLFKAGAVGRVGKVSDGTSHLDFEPEEQKRGESLSLAVATFETGRHARDDRRYARLPRLHRRGHLRLPGGRRRDPRDGRDGRRGGGPRAGGRARAVHRDRGVLLHQQVRQGERRPDRRARRASGDVREQDRAAPAGDRLGPRLHGLRRPGPSQGVHVRWDARRSSRRSPTGWPTRWRAGATSSSRPRRRRTTTSS